MSDQPTARGRRSASVPAAARLVGELEQTIHQPDGSVVVNRANLREQPVKRPPHPYGDWLVVSAPTALRLATEVSQKEARAGNRNLGRMGVDDFRVLFYLLGTAEFGNYLTLSQGQIAAALGMQRPNVNRALRKLVALGLVVLDRLASRPGVPQRFHLANALAWKGSAADLARLQEQERQESSPVTKIRRARSEPASKAG